MSGVGDLVLVTTSFPIKGDGSEAAGSFVSDLAEELGRRIAVRVVAPGPRSMREPWSNGVEVFRYAAPSRALSMLRPWRPGDMRRILDVLRIGEEATRQAVAAGPTAHILALWALPSGHWARVVSRAAGIPYSVWTLGSDIWTLGRIPLVRRRLRQVLRDAHNCYADGLKLAEDTRRIGEREVDFLPSTRGVIGQREQPLSGVPPYRLLFLGRWHTNKGIDLLLEALSSLSDDDWSRIAGVEIFGGGPLAPQVHAGAMRLRTQGRPVELGGYIDKLAAAQAILRADYVLIPSRIESIPVVFSDAIKLGVPVVAMPVGDLPDLLRRFACGEVASAMSASAFTDAIRSVLAKSPRQYIDGTARAAQLFDLPTIALRLTNLTREGSGG